MEALFQGLVEGLKYKAMLTSETMRLAVSERGTDQFPGVPLFKTEYLFPGETSLDKVCKAVRS